MRISLKKIGQIVHGNVVGDSSYTITGVSSFEHAQSNHITFADNPKFLKKVNLSRAGAIIVSEKYKEQIGNLVQVKNPRLAFAKLLKLFNPVEKKTPGINTLSFISENVSIGINAHISAFVKVGKNTTIGNNSTLHSGVVIGSNVTIGNNSTIYPNVTIRKDCQIGHNVTIHSGTVIGSDGFGFVNNEKDYHKIPHIGIVQIDNDVEIGSCNTIDRATIGKTWIKNGVKTDNLVHIGHNVTIGTNTLIISNVAIAGSTEIGNNVIIAGKAGIADHLNIGNNTKIGPKAGVVKHVADNEIVSGSPAMPHKQWLRVQRTLPNLPSLFKTIKKLEKKIKLLEKNQT